MSFPNLQDRVLKSQGAEEVHFHSLATEKNLPRRKTCKSGPNGSYRKDTWLHSLCSPLPLLPARPGSPRWEGLPGAQHTFGREGATTKVLKEIQLPWKSSSVQQSAVLTARNEPPKPSGDGREAAQRWAAPRRGVRAQHHEMDSRFLPLSERSSWTKSAPF